MVIVPQGDLSPQTLYRFFDANDVLLYVGITNDAGTRWRNHSRKKGWWREVCRVRVEHFDSRAEVEAAEKAAIIAEAPVHNVQHNGGSRRGLVSVGMSGSVSEGAPSPNAQQWTFESRGGHERTTPLWLCWEVNCDPVSDEYCIDEIDPDDLWREWVRRYPRDPEAESVFGAGAVGIDWYIEGHGTFESAPYQDVRRKALAWRRGGMTVEEMAAELEDRNFLRHYTEPRDAVTGESIRWASLDVVDKVWRAHDLPRGPYTDKGGFIQEATGWKPAALQPFVNVELLARASNLARPSSFVERRRWVA